jgi:molybdopterin-guanine dinucleotide biosynthesis protein A
MKIAGLILAGGRSSRMGEDKAFAMLNGRSLIARVAASLQPQVEILLINSNGDPANFAEFDCPVVRDCLPGRRGPLAGLLTGLLWAKAHLPQVTHILSAPCDVPGLPPAIAHSLSYALAEANAQIAIARDEDGPQPTIGLWPVTLAERLRHDLVVRDMRGMQAWLRQFAIAEVRGPRLPNINTPQELLAAQSGF